MIKNNTSLCVCSTLTRTLRNERELTDSLILHPRQVQGAESQGKGVTCLEAQQGSQLRPKRFHCEFRIPLSRQSCTATCTILTSIGPLLWQTAIPEPTGRDRFLMRPIFNIFLSKGWRKNKKDGGEEEERQEAGRGRGEDRGGPWEAELCSLLHCVRRSGHVSGAQLTRKKDWMNKGLKDITLALEQSE